MNTREAILAVRAGISAGTGFARRPRRFLPVVRVAGFVWAAGLAGTVRGDAPKPRETTLVRFLCVSPSLPSKFVRQPDGYYLPVPFDYDERPPGAVFVRTNAGYRPVPFAQNGLSPSFEIPDEAETASSPGFYFRAARSDDARKVLENAASSGVSAAAPAHPAGDKTVWRPIAPPLPHDGGEHLLCLYNPDPKARWYPAKSLDIPAGAADFPAESGMAVNLSARTVYVKIGDNGRTLTLAPGAWAVVRAAGDRDGRVLLKAAAPLAGAKPAVVYRRAHPAPHGGRMLVVFSEAVPVQGIPLDVLVAPLDNPRPPALPEGVRR